MTNNNIKIFTGHSGCVVQLCKNSNGCLIVKKTSSDIVYNKRLEKQLIKQRLFKSNCRGVSSPKILKSYTNQDNLYTFEMQLIDGQSISQYILHTDIPAINLLLDKLLDMFNINYQFDDHSSTIFQNKIKQLEKTISYKHESVDETFTKLKSFKFDKIHKSYCHGDLTLENILISNEGEIYVIDFLDSFYDSWMIDAAKILQDIEIGWVYRFETPDANRDIRLALVKQKFINKLLQLKDGKQLIISIYYILLLNLIRIYPYAKEELTLLFLNESTKKIKNKINEMEEEKEWQL